MFFHFLKRSFERSKVVYTTFHLRVDIKKLFYSNLLLILLFLASFYILRELREDIVFSTSIFFDHNRVFSWLYYVLDPFLIYILSSVFVCTIIIFKVFGFRKTGGSRLLKILLALFLGATLALIVLLTEYYFIEKRVLKPIFNIDRPLARPEIPCIRYLVYHPDDVEMRERILQKDFSTLRATRELDRG